MKSISLFFVALALSPAVSQAANIHGGTFVRVQSPESEGVEVELGACESYDTCVTVKVIPAGKASKAAVGCAFFKGNVSGDSGTGKLSACGLLSRTGTFKVVDKDSFNVEGGDELRMYRRK